MTKKTSPTIARLKSKISKPQTLRVLMVEDSEDDALLIIRELKKGGYDPVYERVETATAMKKALKEKQWDIILCDYKLPKFSGPKVIAVLKETNIDIPIIIVSGTIGEETAVECTRLGTHDYIMKDNLSRLCPAIARELEEADSRSKRKQVEEALRQSEEKYRNLVERASDGIGIAQEGILRYTNAKLAQIGGYSVEELTGKPFTDFFTPEEVPKVLDRYKRRMAGKDVASVYETALRHKNGSIINVEVNAGVITYEGKPADLVLVRDVTERKRMEKALKESEVTLLTLINAAKDSVILMDTRGVILNLNKIAAERLGQSKDELLGTYADDALPEDIARMRRSIILQILETKETIRFEDLRNGIWFDTVASPIMDKYGAVSKIAIIARDITERKQVEKELRESEERMKSIFRAAPTGIGVLTDRTFMDVNLRMCEMTGYTKEELIGASARVLYPTQDDFDYVGIEKYRQIAQKGTGSVETRWKKTDGTIIDVLLSSTPIDPSDLSRGVTFTALDITERKQAEEVLRESEALYRSQFEDHSAVKLLIDPDTGNIIDANEAAANFYGWSRENLKQMKIQEINTLSPEEVEKEMEKAKANKRIHFEFRHRRADGSIRDVDVFSSAIKAKGKDLLHSIIHDITDRNRLENILEKEREELKLIIDSSPIIVFYKDREGKFIRVNKIFAELLNMPVENFVGKTVFDFYSSQIAQSMTDDDQEVFQSRRPKLSIMEQYESASGIRWVQTDKIPIFDKDGIPIGLIGFAQDFTERKQAEEALRKSEESFRLSLDDSPLGVRIVTAEGETLYANRAVLDMYCYENIEELRKKPLKERYTPDSYAEFQIRKEKRERGEFGSSEYEISIIRKTGEIRHIQVFRKEVIWNGAKQFQIIYQDITKHKNAEADLLKSEEKYRSIVENAQEGIYQSTPEGRHLTINPAFARMLGYDSPEEVMSTITDIAQQLYVNPADRENLLKLVNEKGLVTDFETEFYKKDGSRIWVSVNMHVVRDEQGKIIYYQGIDQDITERKKVEAERQENIERLRKSLGATINAMAVTAETRDPYTAGHQRRVADLARAIAVEMNLGRDQIDSVRMASMIHDIGKISIPSEILTKPTALSSLEFNLIKTHPESGYNILKDIEFPWPIARIVLEHHERINGSGYPSGLKGEQILLESKIIAIADVVEAISSNRPYRPAKGLEAALTEISKNKGILYEPDIADACLRLFHERNYNLAA